MTLLQFSACQKWNYNRANRRKVTNFEQQNDKNGVILREDLSPNTPVNWWSWHRISKGFPTSNPPAAEEYLKTKYKTCCLGFDADDFEDEDEDDPEIKNDPIYSLDLQVITLNRPLDLSVYSVSLK